MAIINKIGFFGGLVLLLAVLLLNGCTASMQARSAFEEAEQFVAEERFDQAVEKYTLATDLEPSNKTYKLKLISSRTRAAATHISQARSLTKEGKFTEAIEEYRLAKRLDSSIEVATQEEKAVQNLLEAQRLAEEGAEFYGTKNFILARKAIDKALQLDPRNARALAIKDLLGSYGNIAAMDGIELDVASTEPITLSFNRIKVKEVFRVLSRLSGINFIFDEKVRDDTISVFLEQGSFAQAMELILQMNGLSKKVLNGKTILIYPQTREKEKQYDDFLIQTFYLSHIDAKKAVNLLRTMLQLRKIYVHEELNALVIRDRPDVIRLAEQVLNAADRDNSEVIFALELVSVSDSDTLDLGAQLSNYSVGVGFSKDGVDPPKLISGALPSGAGSDLSNLVQNLHGLQTYYTVPSAVFNFAKTLKSTDILANPKIRVRNSEKAKVHVGTREPIITTVTTDISTSTNVQYIDVGIKLDVEPSIQLNNTVKTKLKLEVSQVIQREEAGSPDSPVTALTLSTTNAETVLTLRDGVQTIIGGLFEQVETKQKDTIPFIGEIPLLGDLLSRNFNADDKREILLSITPYIVNQIDVPEIDVATIWSGGEDNLKTGPNFGAFAQRLMSEIESTTPHAAPGVKLLQTGKSSADGDGVVETTDSHHEVVDLQVTAGDPQDDAALPAEETNAKDPSLANVDERTSSEAVPTEVLADNENAGVVEAASVYVVAPKEVDESFSVAVEVKDIAQLFSAALFVKYDPKVVEVVSVEEGPFLKQAGMPTVFSSSPNNTTGEVIVGCKQESGGMGVYGSGILFTMNFRPVATGETMLELNRINFRNPEGGRLEIVSEASMIKVR